MGAIGKFRSCVGIAEIMDSDPLAFLSSFGKACQFSLSGGDPITSLGLGVNLTPANLFFFAHPIFRSGPRSPSHTEIHVIARSSLEQILPKNCHSADVRFGGVVGWCAPVQGGVWICSDFPVEFVTSREDFQRRVRAWKYAWVPIGPVRLETFFGSAPRQFGGDCGVPECCWHESVTFVEFRLGHRYKPVLFVTKV